MSKSTLHTIWKLVIEQDNIKNDHRKAFHFLLEYEKNAICMHVILASVYTRMLPFYLVKNRLKCPFYLPMANLAKSWPEGC